MKSIFEKWNAYIEESQESSRLREIEYNTRLASDLFGLQESGDEQKSAEAVSKINEGQWEPQSADSFYFSLTCQDQEPETCHNKHPEMTTVYSTADLSKMELYKLEGLNAGFALKEKDGKIQEVVAVHNNEPGVAGIGKLLMEKAIAHGGCYLDHFATNALNGLYSSMGFEDYKVMEFDPQYVSKEFVAKYGEADIIFRKHNSC